ncbi:hypothetical protein Tco_0908302 [Tanacetum coccineum]|uniref:Transposase, Ptta/En/Spm, transposase, Tnp1/En/Spm-like protein n=1 Tax=Tanacetum coccineum TaxID=301880 RepID=A0ABQ5CNV4_9ASTR
MIIKKDSEIVKAKVERKSIALKAKKESSDEECSTSGSEDEEYAMAVRDFKKFFKRRENALEAAENPKSSIVECPKPPKDKNQRAFVEGSWSDSGEEDDEKVKDETCLVAHASSEDILIEEWMMMENKCCGELMIENHWMGKLLKEVLMIDELSIVETDKVNHTVEMDMLKLVVEVECFGKCVDEFDKVTVLFGEMQLKQEDRVTS